MNSAIGFQVTNDAVLRLGPHFLQPGEEVREFLVLAPFEAVVVNAVLVGPDAREDARPAGTADGVVLLVTVAQDQAGGRMNPAGHQGVQVGSGGLLDRVEPRAVDADVENLFGRFGSGHCQRTGEDEKHGTQSPDQWSG